MEESSSGKLMIYLFFVHHKLQVHHVEPSNVHQMRGVWKKMAFPSVLGTHVKIAKERGSIL